MDDSPLIRMLRERENATHSMFELGMGSRRQPFDQYSPLLANFGGNRSLRFAENARVLRPEWLSSVNITNATKIASSIKDRFSAGEQLIHFRPPRGEDQDAYPALDPFLPDQRRGETKRQPEQGELRAGMVIPGISPFPKPGQSFEQFKNSVQPKSGPKTTSAISRPAKTPSPAAKVDRASSKVFSRVQEVPTSQDRMAFEEPEVKNLESGKENSKELPEPKLADYPNEQAPKVVEQVGNEGKKEIAKPPISKQQPQATLKPTAKATENKVRRQIDDNKADSGPSIPEFKVDLGSPEVEDRPSVPMADNDAIAEAEPVEKPRAPLAKPIVQTDKNVDLPDVKVAKPLPLPSSSKVGSEERKPIAQVRAGEKDNNVDGSDDRPVATAKLATRSEEKEARAETPKMIQRVTDRQIVSDRAISESIRGTEPVKREPLPSTSKEEIKIARPLDVASEYGNDEDLPEVQLYGSKIEVPFSKKNVDISEPNETKITAKPFLPERKERAASQLPSARRVEIDKPQISEADAFSEMGHPKSDPYPYRSQENKQPRSMSVLAPMAMPHAPATIQRQPEAKNTVEPIPSAPKEPPQPTVGKNELINAEPNTDTVLPTKTRSSTSAAPVVQRMWDEHSEMSSSAGSSGQVEQNTNSDSGAEPDLDVLAEQVLPLVKHLLEIEIERTGGRSGR